METRKHKSIMILAAVMAILGLFICVKSTGRAAVPPALDLYMAEGGEKYEVGLWRTIGTKERPVGTLEDIEDLLKLYKKKGEKFGDVTVHIAEGRYENHKVYWDYNNAPYKTIIEGAGNDKTIFTVVAEPGEKKITKKYTFFQLRIDGNTNLTLQKMAIKYYWRAVHIQPKTDGKRIQYTTLQDLLISHVGSLYTAMSQNKYVKVTGKKYDYGLSERYRGESAVTLKDARKTVISDCTFEYMQNDENNKDLRVQRKNNATYQGLSGTDNNDHARKYLHTIYLNNNSSYNTIERNHFNYCDSSVIKFRNNSSCNIVKSNWFHCSGDGKFIGEYDELSWNNKTNDIEIDKDTGEVVGEKASFQNLIWDNHFGKGYNENVVTAGNDKRQPIISIVSKYKHFREYGHINGKYKFILRNNKYEQVSNSILKDSPNYDEEFADYVAPSLNIPSLKAGERLIKITASDSRRTKADNLGAGIKRVTVTHNGTTTEVSLTKKANMGKFTYTGTYTGKEKGQYTIVATDWAERVIKQSVELK